MGQTYEAFVADIETVCEREQDNIKVQRDIIEIIENYFNLSYYGMLIRIPEVLARTGREGSLSFTLTHVNGLLVLKTTNFTFKLC